MDNGNKFFHKYLNNGTLKDEVLEITKKIKKKENIKSDSISILINDNKVLLLYSIENKKND